jgi:hypothetical protein
MKRYVKPMAPLYDYCLHFTVNVMENGKLD